jgi:heat shock protein HslJ
MRNKIFAATLLLTALIATACGGGQPAAPAPTIPAAAPTNPPEQPKEQPVSSKDTLAGTSWLLTTLNGQPALKDTIVTLNFMDGKAAGSDGCNSYTGSYTADGASIKFGQMASTMMACPDPIMKQAAAYQQALGQAATYKADAAQLTLYDANGKELAAFNAQSSDLAGTSWIVTGYNNGKQAVVSVMASTELTANFGADGKLSGNSGCNTYTSSYQLEGNKITIGPAATTRMACEPAVMEQETQYLAALQSAATYRIDGSKMEMRTADGALAATFQKAPSGSDALAGSAWNVISYNNGKQAVVSVMLNTSITADFGVDGMLTGNGGCNNYAATYQTDGAKISIGPVNSTRMACEQAVMDQETQYLAALQSAATYRIDGSKMEMRTADGALAVSFQKAAAVKPAPSTLSSSGLQPSQIKLDTQGLPYSWQAVSVPATPYDASQPPGPKGLPEHIEVLFGAATPAERRPDMPVMYIIPVDAYRQLWDSAGNPFVSDMIARIYTRTVALPSPLPTNEWPALPPEEAVGYNDLAVQAGRAGSTDLSASKSGYRLVGRWSQSPNPVTNQGLRYVYQGFTNDGKYLVAFFYPVTTKALPMTADQVSAEDMAQFNADPLAALQEKANELNALSPADWDPDLTRLNALVASLQIEGMKPAGLLDQTWAWVGTQPIGGPVKPLADPRDYHVMFKADGTLSFQADCNRGSGNFTYEGGMVGNLRTDMGASTMAACNDGEQGQQFIGGLTAAQNYKVRPGGTTLELVLPAGGGSLIFEAK